MSRFNTGNPIGSADPRDRDDNSKNFDLAVNDRDNDTFVDRFGEERLTLSGMERRAQEALEEILIAGGQIFPDEETGRAAVSDDTYFLTEGDSEDVATILWQRIDSSESRRVADNPSAELLRETVLISDAALEISSRPGELWGEFHSDDEDQPMHAITDDNGNAIAMWGEDGYQLNQSRGEFHSEDGQPIFAITDIDDRPIFEVDEDRQPVIPLIAEFHSEDGQPIFAQLDRDGRVISGVDEHGNPIRGATSFDELPFSSQHVLPGDGWNKHGSVSVQREFSPMYSMPMATLFPTHLDVYAACDAEMAEFSDYITREKHGEDDWDNEILAYVFAPPTPRWHEAVYPDAVVAPPKIIVVSGVHGDETHCVATNVIFMREICRMWKELPDMDLYRWGIRWVFVPVLNPSGFDARNRRNDNDVDLNRNFPTGWDDADPSTRGPAPASEGETKALIDLLEAHDDAVVVIDHHRTQNFFNPSRGYAAWIAVDSDETLGVACKSVAETTAFVRKHFDFFTQDNTGHETITGHFPGSVGMEASAKGFDSYLLETPNVFGGDNRFDARFFARESLHILLKNVIAKEMNSRLQHMPTE